MSVHLIGEPTPGAELMAGSAWREIEDLAKRICEKLDIAPSYTYRVDVEIGRVTVHLFRGRDGRCKGDKHVVDGDVAVETVVFELPSREAESCA